MGESKDNQIRVYFMANEYFIIQKKSTTFDPKNSGLNNRVIISTIQF